MTSRLFQILAAGAACATLLAGNFARADEYPSKPIRVIVPLAPGGIADIIARSLAQKLAESGKARLVVENRTGGGGVPGADAAAKAAPDGYTLLLGFHAVLAILPHMVKGLPYDPLKDFAAVSHVITVPSVLVVHPSVAANTVQELIALAKASPGRLSFASQGPGSTGHIVGELFRLQTGIDILHVPYRGAAPATQDLIGGHVTMMFDTPPLALPHIQAGRVRPLALTAAKRASAIPDVPTMAEAGIDGIESGAWFGFVAPTGTPAAAIAWLNREIKDAFSAQDARARLETQGGAMFLGPPESFAAHIAAEHARWGSVVRRAGIKLE